MDSNSTAEIEQIGDVKCVANSVSYANTVAIEVELATPVHLFLIYLIISLIIILQ